MQLSARNIEYIVFLLQLIGTSLQIIGSIILTFYVKRKVKLQDEDRSIEFVNKNPKDYGPGEESPMQYHQRKINEALNERNKIGFIGFIVTLIGSILMLVSILIGYYSL